MNRLVWLFGLTIFVIAFAHVDWTSTFDACVASIGLIVLFVIVMWKYHSKKKAKVKVVKKIAEMVVEYSNAVTKYGIKSSQALALRKQGGENVEFLRYVDTVDNLKRAPEKQKKQKDKKKKKRKQARDQRKRNRKK